MTEKKVALDKLLFFASLDGGKGFIPLDCDYTYGGKSSTFGGKGDHTVDEETKSVKCHTCLLIPTKGYSMEVLVTPWRGVERGADWDIDDDAVIDRFTVEFGKIKRYTMFYEKAKSSMDTGAELIVGGHFWSSNQAKAGVCYINYKTDPATYARVRKEREAAEEKAEVEKKQREAVEKKERDEKEAKERAEHAIKITEEQMAKNEETIRKLLKENNDMEAAMPGMKRKLGLSASEQNPAKKAKTEPEVRVITHSVFNNARF